MNELDDIAEEAAMEIDAKSSSDMDCVIIRAAIDKALEVVVPIVVEQCAKQCEQWGTAKVVKWQDSELSEDAKVSAWGALQCGHAIRAMTKQLLETLKGNSSVTSAGNHPSIEGVRMSNETYMYGCLLIVVIGAAITILAIRRIRQC